jgi:5-methylcytosine-specific restriction endonuclease McrA
MKKSRVPKTRNGGKLTEAAFWGALRSGLRRQFRFWKPATDALNASRIPLAGPRGRKWAYICAKCGKPYKRDDVQIDHVVPVGQLLSYSDLPGFVQRMTPEDPSAYQILCSTCHQEKTNSERSAQLLPFTEPSA